MAHLVAIELPIKSRDSHGSVSITSYVDGGSRRALVRAPTGTDFIDADVQKYEINIVIEMARVVDIDTDARLAVTRFDTGTTFKVHVVSVVHLDHLGRITRVLGRTLDPDPNP